MWHLRPSHAAVALGALLVVWTPAARAEDPEESPARVETPSVPPPQPPQPRVGPVDERRPSIAIRAGVEVEPQSHADAGLIVGGSLLLAAGLFWDFVGVVGIVGAADDGGDGGYAVKVPVGFAVGVAIVGLTIGVPCTVGGIYLIADGAKGSTDSPDEAVAQGPTLRWQVTPMAATLQATF